MHGMHCSTASALEQNGSYFWTKLVYNLRIHRRILKKILIVDSILGLMIYEKISSCYYKENLQVNCINRQNTNLAWIHNNSGHKIKEYMITVSASCLWVTESNFQLIHSFKQNSLSLILQVLKRRFFGDQI